MPSLATSGLVPLAVTTRFSINFLRKPQAEHDLVADCRLLTLGRGLVVGDVLIYSGREEVPVAHATGTYSAPPGRECTQ